ncbi:hypothetical protein D3C73_1527970 [compost metagenome]
MRPAPIIKSCSNLNISDRGRKGVRHNEREIRDSQADYSVCQRAGEVLCHLVHIQSGADVRRDADAGVL